MLALLTLLASDVTPEPTVSSTVDPVLVTPGFPGFLAIVLIVVAVFLLVWDMQRRIRRTRYREEVAAELDAEAAAQADAADRASTTDDESVDAGEDPATK